MVGWGGLLKEIHKELNLEEEDLVHLDEKDEKEIDEAAYVMVARWNWRKQNYYVD